VDDEDVGQLAAAAGDTVADGVRLLGEKARVDEDDMLAAIDQVARGRRATFRLAVGKPRSVRACRRWVTDEDVVASCVVRCRRKMLGVLIAV
jgi:hypothetical protein